MIGATTDRVHDRVEELRALGIDGHGCVGDLTEERDVGALVSAALDLEGHLDVLVNNAGMMSVAHGDDATAPIEAISLADWNATLARNLTTAFLMSRAVVPAMRAQGGGRIVNIASTTGAVVAMPQQSAYATAKAGMVGFTRALALEVAADGITVNAVAPGWIHTSSATAAERAAGDRTPVGRPGLPDEVAHAVAYLVRPGSSYTTGTVVVVDGGNSIVEDRGA